MVFRLFTALSCSKKATSALVASSMLLCLSLIPANAEALTATGGTISETTVGGTRYKVHTFTANDTFQIISGSGSVEYLVVGGGGGGGYGFQNTPSTFTAGGGGGGSQVSSGTASLGSDSYNVIVGNGGNAGTEVTFWGEDGALSSLSGNNIDASADGGKGGYPGGTSGGPPVFPGLGGWSGNYNYSGGNGNQGSNAAFPNPSFDSDASSWSGSIERATTAYDQTNLSSGMNAYESGPAGGWLKGAGGNRVVRAATNGTFIKGVTYTLTLKFRRDRSSGSSFRFYFGNEASGDYVSYDAGNPPWTPWQTYTLTWTPSANRSGVEMWIDRYASGTGSLYAYVDSLSLSSNSNDIRSGGGGAGAAANGSDGSSINSNKGDGGAGLQNTITGSNISYGGGGGGGGSVRDSDRFYGLGSDGGGSGYSPNQNAAANRGGGGGGGGYNSGLLAAGKGGDGVVVVRYLAPANKPVAVGVSSIITKDTTPTVAFSGDSGDSFTCQVEDLTNPLASGDFVACSSPYTPAVPLNDGDYRINVVASNQGGDSQPLSFDLKIDNAAPAASWIEPTSPNKSSVLSYTLNFDEAVDNLTNDDFTISGSASGCSASSSAINSASFTVDVSGCSEGTVNLSLKANAVVDLATNSGPASTKSAAAVTVDRSGPTASWTPPSSPNKSSSLNYDLNFNEPVSGLSGSDLTFSGSASGCSASPDKSSGSTFTVTVSGCSEGTVILSLKMEGVADQASNLGPGVASAAATVTIDRSAATANWAEPSGPTNQPTLSYSLSFNEAISGLSAADFIISDTSCSVTPSASSGMLFTVTVSGCADGPVTLGLAANSVQDGAGNDSPSLIKTAADVTVDRTRPVASWVTPSSPSKSLSYTLNFNESVSGLTASDFLIGGSASGCSVATDKSSGTSFQITLTGCSEAEVQLTLKEDAVADSASNRNLSKNASSVIFDTTPPSLSWSSTPNTPTKSATLNFQLTSSEKLTGLSADDLSNQGTAINCFFTVQGSASPYIVQASNCSEGTVAVRLAAGSVSDLAGNSDENTELTTATVTIDRTPPGVAEITDAPPEAGSNNRPSFSFSGSQGNSFECRLNDGAYQSCSSPHSFNNLDDGEYTFFIRQVDQAGNSSTQVTRQFVIDTTAPRASWTLAPASPTKSDQLVYQMTFSEPVSGLTMEDIEINSQVGDCRFALTEIGPTSAKLIIFGCSDGTVQPKLRANAVSDAVSMLGPINILGSSPVVIDRTAPQPPAINSGPSEGETIRVGETSFTFTGESGAKFECRLDEQPYQDCASPINFTALSQGSHSFAVRQSDRVGNVSTANVRRFIVSLQEDLIDDSPQPIKRPLVLWSAKRQIVKAIVVPTAGISYSLSAKKGVATKKGICKPARVKVQNKFVNRILCSIKLTKGNWLAVVTPRQGTQVGPTNSKTIRIR